MADLPPTTVVPRRSRAAFGRSVSFTSIYPGHIFLGSSVPPLDIPGTSQPLPPARRCLLSRSHPENPDTSLSRSLLEQCRFEDDISPRSSFKERDLWSSSMISDGSLGNKASWASWRGTISASDAHNKVASGISAIKGANFVKQRGLGKQLQDQASALTVALHKHSPTSATCSLGSTAPSGSSEKLIGTPDSDSYSQSSTECLSLSEKKGALLDRLMDFFNAVSPTETQAIHEPSTHVSNSPSSESSSQGTLARQARRGSGKTMASHRPNRRTIHDNQGTPGDSDEEEDNEGLRPKRCKTEDTSNKRLACPFFKRNPHRYKEERSCVGPGWKTIHRLKEHLYRCHTLPIYCLRCHTVFESEDHLRDHSLSDNPCQKRVADEPREALEGINLSQERSLRSRKRSDKTEGEKWEAVFQICFPNDSVIPNPYFEVPTNFDASHSDSATDLSRYEVFVREELQRRMRRELEQRIQQEWFPIEERLKGQILDIARDIQLQLLEEFQQPPSSVADTEPLVAQGNQPDPIEASSNSVPSGHPSRQIWSSIQDVDLHGISGAPVDSSYMATPFGDASGSSQLLSDYDPTQDNPEDFEWANLTEYSMASLSSRAVWESIWTHHDLSELTLAAPADSNRDNFYSC